MKTAKEILEMYEGSPLNKKFEEKTKKKDKEVTNNDIDKYKKDFEREKKLNKLSFQDELDDLVNEVYWLKKFYKERLIEMQESSK